MERQISQGQPFEPRIARTDDCEIPRRDSISRRVINERLRCLMQRTSTCRTKNTECFENLLCGCQQPRPKRVCLLFGARHTAFTLTWDAPLSFGTRPRDLCLKRRTIKSLSLRFWLSSSRSLGRCLLLGQRSPMNLHTVRPYIHTSLMLRQAQHERKILNDIKSPPFVLSTVEGLRQSFSGACRRSRAGSFIVASTPDRFSPPSPATRTAGHRRRPRSRWRWLRADRYWRIRRSVWNRAGPRRRWFCPARFSAPGYLSPTAACNRPSYCS